MDEWMRAGERKERRWAVAGRIAVGAALAIGVVVWLFVTTGLVEVSDDRARKALESSGFRSVKLGGTDALVCAEGESSRHFAATNPQGKRVEGTVCCGLTGLAKGCTLRWGR
jgi:hypothetical protein